MKTTIKLLLCGLLPILFCPVAIANPTAASLAEEISVRHKTIIDELENIKKSGDLSFRKVLPLIKHEISPIIDYKYFASQAVGKYWRKTPAPDKVSITRSFQTLLEKTYAKLLTKYNGQRVEVVDHKTRADETVAVGAHIIDGDREVRVDYIFKIKYGEAKVIDVQVESISLLSTYRRQFKQIITKSGVEGLVKKLSQISKKG